jgi:IS5 family transposase
MDTMLDSSGLELELIKQKIEGASEEDSQPTARMLQRALRYNILLGVTTDSMRGLAMRVADSPLLQWFTWTNFVDAANPASKSSIDRFEKTFEAGEIESLIHGLNQIMMDERKAKELLYQQTALRFDEIFADTTCVKANIHFPVDWVLLRDTARTLVKAIILIRGQGLRHRIGTPEQFMSQMNKLCIEMTHTRKRPDAKKARKAIFRKMKSLAKTIEAHAENYHELLTDRWQETQWSELEKEHILDRMQNVLNLLPQAVHQAHERIIGERRIKNSDKILSLYEDDIHVLVRGKSDAEVEFGNGLYLAEQADGLIVDWNFMKDQPPSDSKLVKDSTKRLQEKYSTIRSYTADRGFDAPDNVVHLEELQIINAICPRSVPRLKEQLEDEEFCRLQKRRGSTEGRIGVFKNAYLSRPLKSKGFENRERRILWSILTHNLWKLSTIAIENQKRHPAATAA